MTLKKVILQTQYLFLPLQVVPYDKDEQQV